MEVVARAGRQVVYDGRWAGIFATPRRGLAILRLTRVLPASVSSRRRRGSAESERTRPACARTSARVIRITRSLAPSPWRRVVLLSLLLLVTACTPPPILRPREGAQAGSTPGRLESRPPPTLVAAVSLQSTSTASPSLQLPSPSPSPSPAASPAGSPSSPPIITGLQPAPGSVLPPGDIAVGARVIGSSDLTDVVFFVDDEPVPIDMSGPPTRMKTVTMVRAFSPGQHLLRIQARDERGAMGGYRWEFTAGTARQALPTSPPRPTEVAEPTATPFPIPTRRPTSTPVPKPGEPKPAEPKPAGATPAVQPIILPAAKPAITPMP
jgi:hypothetical protein